MIELSKLPPDTPAGTWDAIRLAAGDALRDAVLRHPTGCPYILFTGSRSWEHGAHWVGDAAFQVILGLREAWGMERPMSIYHGAARGFDRILHARALDTGFSMAPEATLRVHGEPITEADYEKYGKSLAPIIRDRRMVDQEPDLAIGFPAPGSHTRGTMRTLEFAVEAGIPSYTVFPDTDATKPVNWRFLRFYGTVHVP